MKRNNNFSVSMICILFVLIVIISILPSSVSAEKNQSGGGRYYCPLCEHRDDDDPLYIKERQFYQKIKLIKEVYGDAIDEIALKTAVLHRYGSDNTFNTLYENNFNQSNYKSFWSGMKNLQTNGIDSLTDDEKALVEANEKYDLLTLATLVMVDSNHNGTYSDVCFRDGLAGSRLVGNNDRSESVFWNVINTFTCAKVKIEGNGVIWGDNEKVTSASEVLRLTNINNVCKHGFIGGLYKGIKDVKDEVKKQSMKDTYANQIIEMSNYYKRVYGAYEEEDKCTFSSSVGTGDMTNWRQCDDRWGKMTLPGGASVCSVGCTLTSMAYLIAKSGTKLTVPTIDPGVFVKNTNYASCGPGAPAANCLVWDFSKIAPNFTRISFDIPVNVNNAASVLSTALSEPCNGNKQPFIILYLSMGHWVALDHVENGKVYVMDPSYSGSGLALLEDAWKGFSLNDYSVFCANDVEFGSTGTSTKTTISDHNSAEYKKRLNNLSNYYQCGDLIGNVPVGGSDFCSAGCGTASLMAAQYMYTGEQFDTKKFINDAIQEGWLTEEGGVLSKFSSLDSTPYFTSQWGIAGEYIGRSSDDILNTLKSGKKILFNIGYNSAGQKSSVYPTDAGHFILLDHYDESSNRIYVFDPVGTEERNGYKTMSFLNEHLFPYMSDDPKAITSNKVNMGNVCSNNAKADLNALVDMLGRLEGMLGETCTVRGKPGYVARIIEADQVYVGTSTAYGLTQENCVPAADAVGYTNFYNDMGNGCAEQSYINQMVVNMINDKVEAVKEYYEKVSGGKKLDEYQYHALALIHHHWPVGAYSLIDELAKLSDVRSYDAYKLFLKYNGLGGMYGGIVRREVEFHLFYNGNYDADRDFSYDDTSYYWTKEYYDERVKIYNSDEKNVSRSYSSSIKSNYKNNSENINDFTCVDGKAVAKEQ